MKHAQLITSPNTLVQQSLDALVACCPHLVRLDGYPDVSVSGAYLVHEEWAAALNH
jgi:hypothetical protein